MAMPYLYRGLNGLSLIEADQEFVGRQNAVAATYFQSYPRFLKAIFTYEWEEDCMQNLNINDRRLVKIVVGDAYGLGRQRIMENIRRLTFRRLRESHDDLWNLREALEFFPQREPPSNFTRTNAQHESLVGAGRPMSEIISFI